MIVWMQKAMLSGDVLISSRNSTGFGFVNLRASADFFLWLVEETPDGGW
jgi:hypothetical protein